jgi:predicted ATPase
LGHAQFIIASHSPILLACPGAQILSFDKNPVKRIDYQDTDHYQIYKEFMSDPAKFLMQSKKLPVT